MQTPEQLVERLSKTPTDPDKLLEYINTIDQKLEEAVKYMDHHETNMIKLIIFAEAFQKVLLAKVVSEDEFKQYMQQAALDVQRELLMPDSDIDNSVPFDIEV